MNTTLAVLLAFATPSDGHLEMVQVAHYSIEVPAGYRLTEASTERADFDLYALTSRDGKITICTLYFGNAPRFPVRKWGGKPVETKERDRVAKTFRSANTLEGVITFSGLTYKDTSSTPFGTIHYFSGALDPAEMKVVQRLVDSIQVTQPHIE
jgi:hypothetical protein